ncbi:hypothetical protein NWF24_17600 [Variovorax paradoxus]|uniref:hypothetical protein n=1 Tax=Variovorax paradoxus TaxID=34073 RepID=UPI0021ACDB4A|nr:hypothetical protein [Variovorax paradoxus]UVH54662.1 hypothetical protein NWF24_17600 [Variovorax paradoxus]
MAALAAPELTIVQLIYFQFAGVPIALNSSNSSIDFGGVTYLGAAGLGSVSPIDDGPGEVRGLQLTMSGVSTEAIALALADSSIVQGAPLTIRLAIMDGGTVLDAPIDWGGRVDTLSIEEDGDTCTITVTAESSAVDLLRGNALTTSNADQQYLYPGDRAFEFVVSQANVPIVWPTKQYYIDSR